MKCRNCDKRKLNICFGFDVPFTINDIDAECHTQMNGGVYELVHVVRCPNCEYSTIDEDPFLNKIAVYCNAYNIIVSEKHFCKTGAPKKKG